MVNKVNTGQHLFFIFVFELGPIFRMHWFFQNYSISSVVCLVKNHCFGLHFIKRIKERLIKKGCLNLSRFKANKRQKRKCQEIRDEKVILNGDRDIIKVIIQQQRNENATTNKLRHNFMRWTNSFINVSRTVKKVLGWTWRRWSCKILLKSPNQDEEISLYINNSLGVWISVRCLTLVNQTYDRENTTLKHTAYEFIQNLFRGMTQFSIKVMMHLGKITRNY